MLLIFFKNKGRNFSVWEALDKGPPENNSKYIKNALWKICGQRNLKLWNNGKHVSPDGEQCLPHIILIQ